MNLIEFPIRRHQFTLVAFLCVVALGVASFFALPREEDPYIKAPAFLVTGIYPGASPVDLEREFARPVEDTIAELDEVSRIETNIADGVAVIAVEFEAGADADRKTDELTREINALRPSLPAAIRAIDIERWGPTQVNIVQLALVSPEAPYRVLQETARDLEDVLKAVDGVRNTDSWAYPGRELRVQLDPARMQRLGVTPELVAQAVRAANSSVPAGIVDLGPRSFSVQTTGGYDDIGQLRATVVRTANGLPVRVSDVAEVSWAEALHTHLGRYNGERAVFVTATQQQGHNILAVQKRIDAALDAFEAELPARIRLERGFAQSDNVAARLQRLYTDFGIAIALVLLTLLPLGLRAAGIVMVAVPLSMAIGMASLHALGYSLNQITIAGFVLSLGLLVDDSIVVVENISRHLRMGHSRVDAAILGTRQILQAILGCTATLVLAFLPLAMLPGIPGMFIRVLPVTIISTVLGSLFVALFFIPFIASRVLGSDDPDKPVHNRLLERVMGAIHRYYRPALHYCLARPRATVAVSMGGAVVLAALLVPLAGSSLFPKADTPQFLVGVSTPAGTSLAETDRALRFAEQALARRPEVRGVFANLGHGNPQIYYNHIVANDAPNRAQLFVLLHAHHPRHTPRMLDALRQEFATWPGAKITVHEFLQGEPLSAPIAVRVVGDDLDELEALAAQIHKLVESVPGTRDVTNPLRVARTNLQLAPDPSKAALLGVPMASFDQALRLALAGHNVGAFRASDGEQYDIVLRSTTDARADWGTLRDARIPTVTGELLPLEQLAELRFAAAPTRIQRFDRQRAVTIDAEVATGFNTAAVTRAVVEKLDTFDWPRGYGYRLGGEAEAGAKAFSGIGIAILIALFGIFAILVLEFGDFRSTLIVLTVVPLGAVGGLLMLLLTGYTLSFTASVGLVALLGIEIKNSILLVDFTNQLRQRGAPLDEAIERAGEIRFLPILLTSATAIGGLLPLALQGSGLYSPMAWTIIGGLIASTLLARLVTPVVYKLLPPRMEDRAAVPGLQP